MPGDVSCQGMEGNHEAKLVTVVRSAYQDPPPRHWPPSHSPLAQSPESHREWGVPSLGRAFVVAQPIMSASTAMRV
jgi:hypothetical protein